MASTGYAFAGTGANSASAGSNPWANATRVTADDDSYATSTDDNSGDAKSQMLRATNFGFAVPAGATVTSADVRIRRKMDVGGGMTSSNYQLINEDAAIGSAQVVNGAWATTEEAAVVSGSWNANLTPAIVNSATFGVQMQAVWDGAGMGTLSAHVDSVEINVNYTESPSGDSGAGVGMGISIGL